MNGDQSLAAFLLRNDIGKEAAAAALNVSRTALYYWLTGKTSPGEQARRDIETWTRGEVSASSWGPPADHRKKSGDVEPFEPEPAAASEQGSKPGDAA